MATLQDLANAIMRQEGYGSPNAPTITNAFNPGALRNSPFAIGSVTGVNGTFAKFASYEDGYNALIWDLEQKQARGMSLRDAIYTYAPPTENNTSQYLTNMVSWTGIPADASLSELLNGDILTSPTDSGGSDISNLFSMGSALSSDTGTVAVGGMVALGLLVLFLSRRG